ncbi:hypothetical protein N7474_005522 [Penicillium riverlandense]|uniref:uncharacterized protein n=1 Tax=Penicillium riverlandense TaxID=1903569 RepID=UPI00254905B8|nr:uncharacterized protein N7474_005522 [Penicillium riverlandense]KAJ5819931.1 hypothetical protein N7474_005522 [Penicillium riverlandense]
MFSLRHIVPILLLGELVAAGFACPGLEWCGPSMVAVRKEWGELTAAERIDYTSAVVCLHHKPAELPSAEYPGVKSRLDDFVATHINYTLRVHYDGLFLPWHRRYLWLWERALREECGYRGHLPYWNWPLWADNLAASPLFDGSETSLSGDGVYDPNEQPLTNGNLTIPRGTGGGCVRGGPFKNIKLHLGPFSRTLTSFTEIPSPGFAYNPRCFSRSLNDWVASRYTNRTIVETLLASRDINEFLTVVDHWPPRMDGVFGVHGGGHFSLGGTMQDLFASPQDPAFFLHHGMVDRMWDIWQDRDEETRRYALNGTGVILNPPSAPLVTLDTVMEFGILDRPRTVREVMSPVEGGLCYTYT